LSPGNLLDAYVMQYYFENTSVRVVDMLSDYAYLRMWKPTRHAVFNLSVFKRSLSGFLDSHGTRGLYALQDIHGATTHKAINMLRRLDLFGRSPK